MKKSLFATLLICVLTSVMSFAQDHETKQFTYEDADMEDVVSALENINVKIRKFKMPITREESYTPTLIVEEYKNGELLKTNNIQLQPTYREIKYEGYTEFKTYFYDHITFIFNSLDPKKHMMHYICKETSSGGYPLIWPKDGEENKEEDNKRVISYHLRPFSAQDLVPGKETPLFLYGSMWYDEKFNIYRFCGSKEVDPEMEDDLFKLSPHYFVIKIKLDPNPDFKIDLNQE